MSHVRVRSSSIYSIKYDADKQDLAARYVCGRCRGSHVGEYNCKQCSGFGFDGEYTFKGVPPEVHEKLMADEGSIGKTFHELIKKGGYKFTRSEE